MPYVGLAGLVWLLDRASKIWITRTMQLWAVRPIAGQWLTFTYVHNTGAAFGVLGGRTFALSLLTIAVLAGLFFFREKLDALSRSGKFALSLIIGGALGNLFDRLVLGHVIDFIDLQFWPVFNLADSAIVVGAVMMAWAVWRMEASGGHH